MLARMKVWLEFKRRRKRTSRKNRIDGMGWDEMGWVNRRRRETGVG